MAVWTRLWIVYIVWGSTYLAIRYMVETVPAVLGSGLRFLIAGLLFAAWLTIRRGPGALRATPVELASCAFVGLALLLGGNGLVSVAENAHMPSGLTALVVASVPLWVVLFRRLSGDRVSRTTTFWVAVGFAGVGLLLLPGERPDGATIGGVLTVVAAAFCWATGSFMGGRLPTPADPLRTTTWQMLIGGGVMVVVGFATGETVDLGAVSGRSIAAFVYLVLVGSLVAYTAYVWLLRNAPISQVSTYAYVNPVVAIALGALFVGESLTPVVAVAALVIVASVAGTIRQESVRRAPAAPKEAPQQVGSRA